VIVVVGIDGASPDVIESLLAEGRLPAFQRLKTEGAFGPLLSDVAMTPVSWTTLGTGRRYASHGIDPSWGPVRTFFASPSEIRVARLWDHLRAGGLSVRVLNWFFLDPPEELTPHYPSPKGATTVWPVSPLPGLLAARREDAVLSAEIDLDDVQHRYRWYLDHRRETVERCWPADSRESAGRLAERVLEDYERADTLLGQVLGTLGPADVLVVVSDHGFFPKSRLEKNLSGGPGLCRLLSCEPPASGSGDRQRGHWQGRSLLLTSEERRREVPFPVTAPDCGQVKQLLIFDAVVVTPELPGRTLPEELGKDLAAIAHEGLPVFAIEVEARDRLVLVPSHAMLRRAEYALETFHVPPWFSVYVETGDHYGTTPGIVALWGRGIRPGSEVGFATLIDIAPTVLCLAGVPVARELEGRVLSAPLLERCPYGAGSPGTSSNATSEKGLTGKTMPNPTHEEVEKLRSLGYLR